MNIYIYINKFPVFLGKGRTPNLQHFKGRPADVDPARREQYLSDSDFQSVFGMSFADFQKSPKWKQQNAKWLGGEIDEFFFFT